MLSLCEYCECITKTLKNKCNKCGAPKQRHKRVQQRGGKRDIRHDNNDCI